MNVSSFVLERVLRQLGVREESIRQFSIAGRLSDVGGKGFPKELFQLSAPVVLRGLLNFAVLQMKRDWLFPYWVHKQLDPADNAFIARSQNPIFVNTTHRNWTLLGSPTGFYEAIIDRRGLATPLPREWSVDVWLRTADGLYTPSTSDTVLQRANTMHPSVTTVHNAFGLRLTQEHFVASIRGGQDILFQEAVVENTLSRRARGDLIVAVRPFNPEGVAPIERISIEQKRIIVVDRSLGVVFSEDPNLTVLSNAQRGDIAALAGIDEWPRSSLHEEVLDERSVSCSSGLGHAASFFTFDLEPGSKKTVHYSVALGEAADLRRTKVKNTWRVSFGARKEKARIAWSHELQHGASISLGDSFLQDTLDAHRLALLQLSDGSFISPGPFVYHHFWYRDAVPMCRALDVLGFHERSRAVLNAFEHQQRSDGFFEGPDGEWDSNGAVLFGCHEHYRRTRSTMWLKGRLPMLRRGADWILAQRKKTTARTDATKGLLPESLSAEHLGTTDVYYWDTFHAVAGLRSYMQLLRESKDLQGADRIEKHVRMFEADVRNSLARVKRRLGVDLIPGTPGRTFDESAIGSICGVYPLRIHDLDASGFAASVEEIIRRFVDEKGFYHPFIHSGYNAYLTLQLAHCLMGLGSIDKAWAIAQRMLRQGGPTFAYPEAIHPRTGGGSMGDGHHGWAAAEVLLFLRSAIVNDEGTDLVLLEAGAPLLGSGRMIRVKNLPTTFGRITFSIETDEHQVQFDFHPQYFASRKPASVILHLPYRVIRAVPSTASHLLSFESAAGSSTLRLHPDTRSVYLVTSSEHGEL